MHARRPKTADEWREWRRKEGSSSARKPADDDLAEALRASQEDIERAREARLRRFG